MKNIFSVFTLIFLVFSASAASQIPTPSNDFQIWNEISVAFPIIKAKDKNNKEFDRLTFSLNGVLRFGDKISRLVDKRIGFGFGYRLNKYISFAPDYLYRGNKPSRGVKQYEHRLRFALALENKWRRFSLIDRNQIEYRIRHSRKDSVRYKNRLRFEYPLKKSKKEIFTPFVSNEPFYDFSEKKLTRNELFAGINKKFNNGFSADFYYLFVKDRGFPKIVNGVGINLRFKSNWFIP